MARKQFTVFKNGYVTETGNVLEPLRIASGKTEVSAKKKSKVTKLNKVDYHTVQEEYDGLYWVSIEGTEKEF